MLERKGTAVIIPDPNSPVINMILALVKIFSLSLHDEMTEKVFHPMQKKLIRENNSEGPRKGPGKANFYQPIGFVLKRYDGAACNRTGGFRNEVAKDTSGAETRGPRQPAPWFQQSSRLLARSYH
ncbi:MAG: hypothetical protein ACLGJB_20215 [Blastocatellia bacterium]